MLPGSCAIIAVCFHCWLHIHLNFGLLSCDQPHRPILVLGLGLILGLCRDARPLAFTFVLILFGVAMAIAVSSLSLPCHVPRPRLRRHLRPHPHLHLCLLLRLCLYLPFCPSGAVCQVRNAATIVAAVIIVGFPRSACRNLLRLNPTSLKMMS